MKPEIVEHLRNEHGIRGEPAEFEVGDRGLGGLGAPAVLYWSWVH